MTISVREGEPLDINLLASVSDPDAGDTLTISITRQPTNGQLTQLAFPVGTWRYTPLASFTGAVSFGFQVTDGALTFATATATLDIKGGCLLDVALQLGVAPLMQQYSSCSSWCHK